MRDTEANAGSNAAAPSRLPRGKNRVALRSVQGGVDVEPVKGASMRRTAVMLVGVVSLALATLFDPGNRSST